MVRGFVRGVAGSAGSGWRAARGWSGWRTRRGWALVAVGVLVAGILPVILVAGHRSARRWSDCRGPCRSARNPHRRSDRRTPRPDPRWARDQLPLAVGDGRLKQPPAGARGTGRPEYSSTSVVVSLRDPANTAPLTSRGATVVGEIAGTGFVGSARRATRPPWWRRCSTTPGSWRRRWTSGGAPRAVPNDPFYWPNQQTVPEPDPDARRVGPADRRDVAGRRRRGHRRRGESSRSGRPRRRRVQRGVARLADDR